MLSTRLSTTAKNNFEKDFFKLLKNNVFGKNMEIIRNHIGMNLVANRERYSNSAIKPNF